MASGQDIYRERLTTDASYAAYLQLADRTFLTLPNLVHAAGMSLSAAGTLLAALDAMLLAAWVIAGIGVALIGLAYRLKRSKLDAWLAKQED